MYLKCLRKNSKTNSLQSNIQPAILPAPDMTEKGEMPGSEISSIVDMNSDYENPQIVTAEQIQEARKRLEPFMSETPCEVRNSFDSKCSFFEAFSYGALANFSIRYKKRTDVLNTIFFLILVKNVWYSSGQQFVRYI